MRRLTFGWMAVVVLWGCIESNPQPSPGKGDTQNGGNDTKEPSFDTVTGDNALPSDVVADALMPEDLAGDVGKDLAADLVTGDVDVVDIVDVEDSLDTTDLHDLPDVEIPPAGCCELGGSDCSEGTSCVFVSADEKWGKCMPPLGEGECWGYTDCDMTMEYCSGASIQSCLSVLGIMDVPGHCVHDDPPACCAMDEQCTGGLVCAPFGDGDGTCEPKPKPGECWTDADCYQTQTCEGVATCGCKGMCPMAPTPGKCSPLPEGCCNSDADCGLGDVCRAMPTESGMLPGSCVADPAGPQCFGDIACCWDDSDCFGGTCQGASVCICIELCWVCAGCAPNQMGTCH